MARWWNIEHPLKDIPYSELTEAQKERDKVWARKVLNLIFKWGDSYCYDHAQGQYRYELYTRFDCLMCREQLKKEAGIDTY